MSFDPGSFGIGMVAGMWLWLLLSELLNKVFPKPPKSKRRDHGLGANPPRG